MVNEEFKEKIINEIISYGYTPVKTNHSSFINDDIDYQILDIEVKEKITDYKETILIEKKINDKYDLYEKNIILEIL